MALPTFTMKQLMEAGVHFGHHTRRWNPLMTPYVYGVKDKIHIINLNKTAPLLHRALVALETSNRYYMARMYLIYCLQYVNYSMLCSMRNC